MSALQAILNRDLRRELAQEAEERRAGEALFTQWRDRYATLLCAYMRLHLEAAQFGDPKMMKGPSLVWCNAAVHILTVASIDVQDRFLRSNEKEKDRMVGAVLEDGGIVRMDGFFVELPL